ncbi:YtxH domain-containing protein [Frigoribacterium sp. CG_9.8]|uniref:YtxH domain-containing protein n=1 Tax=Frigoribacterium sp. CG_9.8 TaxID=2787733 RepID=UPI0018C9264A|nr:YtxH domain-containing protein [Frigoribacterium sp. CG_9.8]MBG6108734.1 hypothetical protein [Frigoribacterium sp. CG_9.8]
MRSKILLVVGLAAGYVLGAKAGRDRYEQIKRAADTLWSNPRVQRQVKKAEERALDFAQGRASGVIDFLSDGAKKVVSRSGTTRSDTKRSGTKRSDTKRSDTTRSAAKRSGTSQSGKSAPARSSSAAKPASTSVE